jgi:hypothetical protein
MSRAVQALLLCLCCGVAGCTLDFGRFAYKAKAGAKGDAGGHGDGGASGSECKGRNAGEPFCVGNTLRTCAADLSTFDDVACAPGGSCRKASAGASCVCDSGQTNAAGGCAAGTDGGLDGGLDGGGNAGRDGAVNSSDGAPVNAPPGVELVFPPPGLTDRASIAVRGKLSDPEGDAIAEVRVNDAVAQLSADGTFSVSAPLELGTHRLRVHVQDSRGATADVDTVEVERLAYVFEHAADMVLDSAHQRVIAVDDATDAVVAISIVDGTRTVIVPPTDMPTGRNSVELDAANNRVLVTEHNPGALAWIDLTTGDRTVVSDGSRGTGTAIVPRAAVLDPVMTSRAFVLVDGANSSSAPLIYSVDLATGNRTPLMVTANNVSSCNDILYDQSRSRVLLVCASEGVLAVNITTGAGTFIATGVSRVPAVGRGSPLFNPTHGTVDGDRLVVGGGQYIGNGAIAIHGVDLVSGNHRELAALTLGPDPKPLSRYDSTYPFAYDPATGLGWVLDPGGRLLSARLQPGDRQYFSDVLYGNGASFNKPVSIVDDAKRKRWVVADNGLDALIAVDKKTGDRSVISDATTGGSANPFGSRSLVGVGLDTVHDKLIALDYDTLYAVDPVTGARTVVSHDALGTSFAGAKGLAVAPDGLHALVVGCYGSYPCGGQVVAIDLITDSNRNPPLIMGNRTVFSSQSVGSGPIEGLVGIVAYSGQAISAGYLLIGSSSLLSLDASGNRTAIANASKGAGATLTSMLAVGVDGYEDRAVVINDNGNALLAVDLVTGDRTPVTDSSANAGPYTTFVSNLIADQTNHRLLLAEGWGGNDAGLIEIQLCDRKRNLVADQSRGDWNVSATLLDASKGVLYAGQSPLDTDDKTLGATVLALDVHTAQRTVVSDDSDSGGSVRWTTPIGLALDPASNRLFGATFFYSSPNSLLAIDLGDGAQSVVSDASKGAGVVWQSVFDLAWDGAHDRALLVAAGLPGIIAVDPANGDRTVLSGGPNGSGTAFTSPASGALDNAGNRLLVIDSTQLLAVDLGTGNRTLLSGGSTGSGPAFVKPGRVLMDTVGSRAIVLDQGDSSNGPALIAVALGDGARSKLATLPAGWYTVTSFIAPGLAFDGSSGVAYAGNTNGLFALDPASGDYVLMAGHGK